MADKKNNNKFDKKEYMKIYRQKHKNVNANDSFKCEICGGSYTRRNKSTHEKTIRHKYKVLEEDNKKLRKKT